MLPSIPHPRANSMAGVSLCNLFDVCVDFPRLRFFQTAFSTSPACRPYVAYIASSRSVICALVQMPICTVFQLYTFSSAQTCTLQSAHMYTSAPVQLYMFPLAHLYICAFCNMPIFNLGYPRSGHSLQLATYTYAHMYTCVLVRMLIFTILHMCCFSLVHLRTCTSAHFCNTPIDSLLKF